jgi:succinate dehydrogenase / fumarate reductase membrane anchor subunit
MTNDPNSLKTAASQIQFLGTARSGTPAAWAMHVTSSVLIPLSIAFVFILATLVHKDFAAARAELGSACPTILFLLFVSASIYHMKIGMQSIIDDYIHDTHWKSWALVANLSFCATVGLASVYALLKISFA